MFGVLVCCLSDVVGLRCTLLMVYGVVEGFAVSGGLVCMCM